jgi:hypothetical protein
MKKKQMSLFLVSGALVVSLVACNNTASSGKIPNAQATSGSSVQLTKSEGVFSGSFDATHVDISENGKKRMFTIVDDLKESVKNIQENDKVSFSYETTEAGDNVIHVITDLNGHVVTTTEKKATVIRETKEKEEESTKKTIAKKEKKTETKKETTNMNFNATIEKDFTGEDNRIYYSKDKEMYAEIEFLDADTVVKEQRWRAADELKKNGPLSELFGSNIPSEDFSDAAFVFTSSSSRYNQYVILEKKNGYYIRFFVSIPTEENNVELEYNLWNSLATVSKK